MRVLLLVLALGLAGSFALVRAGEDGDGAESAAAAYRTSGEVGACLRRLARRLETAGVPATVVRYGESTGGRPLEALRVGDAAAVLLVHGGMGARDAAGPVAVLAVGEALADGGKAPETSVLLVPAPNPDALDRFLAGEVPWAGPDRDRDRDGRRGEDGPADADGDGEVLRMRRLDRSGAFAPADPVPGREGKGRGLVEKGTDVRRPLSYDVSDEALDADGDGDVGEDPPGIDGTRDFAGWWDDHGPWAGSGLFPGYAPETRALMELSFSETGLVGWVGLESAGPFVLHASEKGKTWEVDKALHLELGRAIAGAVDRPLKQAGAVLGSDNPGSDLDWATVHLGVPAFRIPVWWIEKQEGRSDKREVADDTDWLEWNDRVLEGRGFVDWHAFDHPTLGPVEIGGWRRFTRYEPPADRLAEAARRAAKGVLALLPYRPRLGILAEVTARGGGLYEVVARATNPGRAPTGTHQLARERLDVGVRLRLEADDGAEVLAGPRRVDLGRLEAGATSGEARWLLRRAAPGRLGVLRARHPKAGRARREVETP